jgi:hypothetical protein
MALPNVFSKSVAEEVIQRIELLLPTAQPLWGTMNAAQMLAHLNVSYEMIFDSTHAKPGAFMKLILKTLVKKKVVTEVPYPKSSRTAPQFIMTGDKDFDAEKARLIAFIRQVQGLGESHFDGKESHSFGALTINEWNVMMYKHLNHHLSQFGV